MSKISTILSRKPKGTFSCLPENSVFKALELMAKYNIGALAVADDEKYYGIMTERDYARKVFIQGKHSAETRVDEIMSINFPPLHLDDSVERCMQLMSEHNLRYLPVFNEGKLEGIISIGDVVSEIIRQQKETISHLQDYIHQ
jgi:CBS domain-containing protein